MDFERAIEHLLDLHARAELRMDKSEGRLKEHEARMEKIEASIKKDKAAAWNYMRAGGRILIQLARDRKETDRQIKALAGENRKTAQELRRLERALLRPSGNGRPGGR